MGCNKKTSVSIGSHLIFPWFFFLQVTTITFAVSPTPPWERLLSHVVTTSEQGFGTVRECRAFPFESFYLFNSTPPLQWGAWKSKENSFTLRAEHIFKCSRWLHRRRLNHHLDTCYSSYFGFNLWMTSPGRYLTQLSHQNRKVTN